MSPEAGVIARAVAMVEAAMLPDHTLLSIQHHFSFVWQTS
jgi:hypothetical protein